MRVWMKVELNFYSLWPRLLDQKEDISDWTDGENAHKDYEYGTLYS